MLKIDLFTAKTQLKFNIQKFNYQNYEEELGKFLIYIFFVVPICLLFYHLYGNIGFGFDIFLQYQVEM